MTQDMLYAVEGAECSLLESAHPCAGQASLFTMSADNAMVQFISRGAPRIMESQVTQLIDACASPFACLSALRWTRLLGFLVALGGVVLPSMTVHSISLLLKANVRPSS